MCLQNNHADFAPEPVDESPCRGFKEESIAAYPSHLLATSRPRPSWADLTTGLEENFAAQELFEWSMLQS
jgi:hypothetical protein